jgi:hypothetical protein
MISWRATRQMNSPKFGVNDPDCLFQAAPALLSRGLHGRLSGRSQVAAALLLALDRLE